MGALLSQPTVLEEPLKIRYRANSLGAKVLELLGLLTVLIIPIIIGFAMSNFVLEYNVFVETPVVTFTDRCLVRYKTAETGERLWGCSDALMDALIGDPRETNLFFSVLSDDRDADGRHDSFTFTMKLPMGSSTDTVTLIEFLPEFDVKLDSYHMKLLFLTAPLIQPSMSLVTGSTSRVMLFDANLAYHGSEIIDISPYVRYDRVYRASLFDTITTVQEASAVGKLGMRYASRNQSLVLDNIIQTAGGAELLPSMGNGATLDLDELLTTTLIVKLRVVDSHVAYQPGPGEIVKWVWVQFFCIAYVVHWVVGWIRWFCVKQALINTIAIWEGRM